MKRHDFIRSLGLGITGVSLPKNAFIQCQKVNVYDNYIKGLTHYHYNKLKGQIQEGDVLNLRRELENEHDNFAIAVYFDVWKIGYVAAYENIVLANMIDAGVELTAVVSQHLIAGDLYRRLAVKVYAELVIPTTRFNQWIKDSSRADDADDLYRNYF